MCSTGGALDAEELQARTRASSRGLRAPLNALVGLKLLNKDDQELFELTAESSIFLVRHKPTFHGAFLLMTSEAMVPHWGKLTEM